MRLRGGRKGGRKSTKKEEQDAEQVVRRRSVEKGRWRTWVHRWRGVQAESMDEEKGKGKNE